MIQYAEILIVDDMPDQIYYVSHILREEGFRVYAATSYEAGKAFIHKKLPDLILLDSKIVDVNGLLVCRKIKEFECTRDIPIIYMTSVAEGDTSVQCFELGASDYIRKPFSKQEFLARVRTQLRLNAQRKELLAVNEGLSSFTSCVSHDLKEPFALISTMMGLLETNLHKHYGEDLPQDITQILDIINTKTDQSMILISRMLDFSRMNHIAAKPKRIHTQEITEDTFAELMALPHNQGRNVDFRCKGLPVIVADEELYRLAIKNLLINALKYSSKKERSVIRVYAVPNASYYVIKVRDNGAGFDMEYVDKIFEMFKRLHTEKEFPGTGVGLALVSRIMTRHHGKIEAYGEVGKGAEMTLYFPRNVKPVK